MRRVIGLILAGLGTFLIVFAVLLPTWIASQVIKFPLNEYQSATLAATNASYFSASSLSQKTGVTMEATYTIKGDGAAGSDSTAVWNEYSYVYDTTNKQVVQQMTRRFAFDRKTAELVNCCGAHVNGDTSIRQTGVIGYVFPIGTKKQTYQVFDTTLNKPMPFVYSGTSTVKGIEVYKFEENVNPVQVATLSVPGSLVNETAATVTLPEYYEMHLIYYVDPVTGALINVNEHQTMSLHDPATGSQALLLFDADLAVTPASLNSVVAQDNSGRNKLNLIETTLPLIFGIVGAVALVAGILMARKPREDVESGPTSPAPEMAAPLSEARAPAPAPEAEQASLIPGMNGEAEAATVESPAAKDEKEVPGPTA